MDDPYMMEAIRDLRRVVDKNNDAAVTDRVQQAGLLATIEQKIIVISDYKRECEETKDRVQTLELWKSNMMGRATLASSAMFIFGGITETIINSWSTISNFFRHT